MTPRAPQLSSILVTPPSPALVVGSTQQFIATGIYNNGTTADLTTQVGWFSSDDTVATITATGLATGVADGEVTITAVLGADSGSTELMVSTAALVSISVAPQQFTMLPGQTQQYGAVGTYDDQSQQSLTPAVTWSSTDPTVVAISATGFATAVAAGVASILATSGTLQGAGAVTISGAEPAPVPGTPADYLRQAQIAMFQLLLGNKPSRVDTPQLGSVEFAATTPAQLQRAIDYLKGLVEAGNQWPTDGTYGSMNAGYQRSRKPFSFFGWP